MHKIIVYIFNWIEKLRFIWEIIVKKIQKYIFIFSKNKSLSENLKSSKFIFFIIFYILKKIIYSALFILI